MQRNANQSVVITIALHSLTESIANSPVGYILLSAPIYAKAKGQKHPLQSKQKILLSCLVHTQRTTTTKKKDTESLCYELSGDQQNANVQLIQCGCTAFQYEIQ